MGNRILMYFWGLGAMHGEYFKKTKASQEQEEKALGLEGRRPETSMGLGKCRSSWVNPHPSLLITRLTYNMSPNWSMNQGIMMMMLG